MFETTLLALLQGVAEFLPISSSGHLVLGKALLGVEAKGLRLDIFLHVGTLLSIAVFYWRVIRRILVEVDWRYALKVIVSAVPAGVVGILFKDDLESLFSSPTAVGWALVFTGAVLLVTRLLPKGGRDVSFLRAFLMGLAQAVAITPGVSRSGMTIAAARATGVESAKCAEFSFLMSIPPIAGAALLEIKDALEAAPAEVSAEPSWGLVLYGSALAAVVGYFSLAVLLKTLKGGRFWLFGPYCIVAGVVTLCFVG